MIATPAPPSTTRMPFELADLRSLSIQDARATLKRFEWLAEFVMYAPGVATAQESRLLLDAIGVLQEVIEA